ncbi:hypothetical protein SHIRM173S_05067 [Streptomyces hirsutus]
MPGTPISCARASTAAGLRAELEQQIDEETRAAYCAKIEQAARSAAPNQGLEVVSRDLMFVRHDAGRGC